MRPLGVYIHFPYCLKKCPYCDFTSFAKARAEIDHAGYADAVLSEIEVRASAFEGRRVETVFFGGGTPSLWEPNELGRVLAAVLGRASSRAADVEVTVECNPTSLDEDRARALFNQGVNRLSIGVQALDADRLSFLGRLHDPAGGLASLAAALRASSGRAVGDVAPRVSADLIYAVATDAQPASAEEAAADAARVADLGPTHVSAYSLTIEPNTAFGDLARRGRLPQAPDETAADAYLAVESELERRGFSHYEISNYARPGAEARHNLGYWRGHDYLGLGCSAFGTLGDGGKAVRYRNTPHPERYVERAIAGDPAFETEQLDGSTLLLERIMLGLRLAEGIDLEAAAAELGVEAWPAKRRRAAERLEVEGRLENVGSLLRVTRASRLFTDGIASSLF